MDLLTTRALPHALDPLGEGAVREVDAILWALGGRHEQPFTPSMLNVGPDFAGLLARLSPVASWEKVSIGKWVNVYRANVKATGEPVLIRVSRDKIDKVGDAIPALWNEVSRVPAVKSRTLRYLGVSCKPMYASILRNLARFCTKYQDSRPSGI